MGYTISYRGLDRAEADTRAVQDVREYLNAPAWDLVVKFAQEATTAKDVQELNIAFGIAGCTGFPFHAFCRTYCLDAYVAWMRSSLGGQPSNVGDDGFPVEVNPDADPELAQAERETRDLLDA